MDVHVGYDGDLLDGRLEISRTYALRENCPFGPSWTLCAIANDRHARGSKNVRDFDETRKMHSGRQAGRSTDRPTATTCELEIARVKSSCGARRLLSERRTPSPHPMTLPSILALHWPLRNNRQTIQLQRACAVMVNIGLQYNLSFLSPPESTLLVVTIAISGEGSSGHAAMRPPEPKPRPPVRPAGHAAFPVWNLQNVANLGGISGFRCIGGGGAA